MFAVMTFSLGITTALWVIATLLLRDMGRPIFLFAVAVAGMEVGLVAFMWVVGGTIATEHRTTTGGRNGGCERINDIPLGQVAVAT